MKQVFSSALQIMAPLLLVSTGGLFSGLSGMLDISLEGLMAIGAFACLAFTHLTGSIVLGVILAALAAMTMSALLSFATLKLKANVFIAGLAVNMLAGGICAVTSEKLFGTQGIVRFPVPTDESGGFFLLLAFALAIISHVVLMRTPYGLHIRGCGKNPEALLSLGLDPDFHRFTSFLISGAMCAIGGSAVMLRLGSYVPNATAGKGWIALVIVFLGGMKPIGLIAASFLFALAESFSNFAQGIWNVPADFILAIPYFVTLLAMTVHSIIEKKRKSFV